ncbi:MAG: hypothetical protein KC636_18510 [Myxococcales bacterium]|nr:hypothetical protein [Myxococcales bacterium]
MVARARSRSSPGVVAVALVLGLARCAGPDDARATEGEATAVETSSDATAATAATETTEASTSAAGEPQPLVTPDAWQLAAAEDDPFADRPPAPSCDAGFGEEGGVFEVESDYCAYGTFLQPSLAEVRAGDALELLLVHDALYADPPATAHVALALAGELAWEVTIAIPGDADVLRPSWTATSDMALGSPVAFHVHNHGANNYRLVSVTVTPAGS